MPRQHLRMDARDNVTTLIDAAVDQLHLTDGAPVAAGVPFGHKAALEPIAKGAPVVKYGVVIGHATQDIAAGEHVHVHNCR
jgi:hypothetical protein